jgi:hypothetical protein
LILNLLSHILSSFLLLLLLFYLLLFWIHISLFSRFLSFLYFVPYLVIIKDFIIRPFDVSSFFSSKNSALFASFHLNSSLHNHLNHFKFTFPYLVNHSYLIVLILKYFVLFISRYFKVSLNLFSLFLIILIHHFLIFVISPLLLQANFFSSFLFSNFID